MIFKSITVVYLVVRYRQSDIFLLKIIPNNLFSIETQVEIIFPVSIIKTEFEGLVEIRRGKFHLSVIGEARLEVNYMQQTRQILHSRYKVVPRIISNG